ncbi:MAG: DUF2190 family protein, partial [Bacteroidia bacterium]|nr:DUF2190 family protein [Bacteroidia bacterium]
AFQPLYISKGSANGDAGRTIDRAYILNPANEHRMEFVGIAAKAATAGSEVPIVSSGRFKIPASLIQGGSFISGEMVYWTGSQFSTTVPTNTDFWLIKVGKALNADNLLVNPDLAASAVYVPPTPSALTINNNVTSPTALPITFNPTTTQAFEIHYQIRRIAGSTENSESGILSGHYNSHLGQWFLVNHSIVGDAFVTFSMSGSSIAYTSSNMTGSPYSGTMVYKTQNTLDFSVDNTATINNNVSSPTSISGMNFGPTVRGVLLFYSVQRKTTSPASEKSESGYISLVRNSTSSSWLISVWGVADNAGISFSVTSGGQVQYTTDNMTGSGYTGTIVWEVLSELS